MVRLHLASESASYKAARRLVSPDFTSSLTVAAPCNLHPPASYQNPYACLRHRLAIPPLPEQIYPEAGIPEASMHIVEALMMAQPEGPFFLGGFSGGAMLSYEVSRQLAALGRMVDGLVLIDIYYPRPKPTPGTAESIWNADVDVFETVSAHTGSSTVASNTQQYLRAIFKAVSAYHPPPMTANERPARTAVIWAEKGMISKCCDSPELMKKLAKRGLTAESRPGFMEDPSLGAIRWSILNKGPGNLGPNGWEKFIGYEPLCSSVKADHLEMVALGQVRSLRGALEQAFGYLTRSSSN